MSTYCDNCNEECQHQHVATCRLCEREVLQCQDMGPFVQIGDSKFRNFICEQCARRISTAWQESLKYHGEDR